VQLIRPILKINGHAKAKRKLSCNKTAQYSACESADENRERYFQSVVAHAISSID
jgi:hypothetical protein